MYEYRERMEPGSNRTSIVTSVVVVLLELSCYFEHFAVCSGGEMGEKRITLLPLGPLELMRSAKDVAFLLNYFFFLFSCPLW